MLCRLIDIGSAESARYHFKLHGTRLKIMIIKEADDKKSSIQILQALLSRPDCTADIRQRIEQEICNIQAGIRGEDEANRIAVRFAYEWHDDAGHWFRSYENENWEFDEHGFMRWRIASINDLPIQERDRKYHWPLGQRPDEHPSLSTLGL